MADKKSKKMPLSLNDRHYRLLQDFSAPPKPPSHDDDIPQFSGITDFDSPLEEGEAKPLKVHDNSRDDESIPQFSGITDYIPLEKEKLTKVKIQGRRRLCKVSTGDGNGSGNEVALDEPRFNDFIDFDSPPLKNVGEGVGENRGGNEIRDILNDLSAKFDFLSIEKRQCPKRIEPVGDGLNIMKEKEMSAEKKLDLPEYASAGSSFSLASDTSDSSSDVIKGAGDEIENVAIEHEQQSHFGNVTDYNNVHGVKKNYEKPYRYEPGSVGGELMSRGHPFVTEIEGKGLNNMDDSFEDGVHGMKKHGGVMKDDPQPRRMDKKLVHVQQSFVSEVEENSDEEDDCVVLSGNKMVNVVKGHGEKFKDESDDSDGVDVLGDCTDDSGLEKDGSIKLSGPKSTYKLPSKIAKMLYPHQRDGLRWLWSLHCQGKGGILGDDMGLGKTMQICGFLAGLFQSRLIKRAMVVAPKTLIPHWIKELSAVGLSEKIREYYGTCPKARQYELQYILQDRGVLLTTYDIVRNNSKSLRGDYYDDEGDEDSVTWDYMILDETKHTWVWSP